MPKKKKKYQAESPVIAGLKLQPHPANEKEAALLVSPIKPDDAAPTRDVVLRLIEWMKQP